MAQCEKCGEEYGIGDFPFCPHGRFVADHLAVIDDSCEMTVENMGPEPMHFTSKADWRAEMKRRGLENNVRHVGMPGSDKSPETTRWI